MTFRNWQWPFIGYSLHYSISIIRYGDGMDFLMKNMQNRNHNQHEKTT
ncbi:MAG: hypothetical protein JXB10_03175 [Pirellulales bacterium]|nr:hypothetical protein [Pirellulales bacterium]